MQAVEMTTDEQSADADALIQGMIADAEKQPVQDMYTAQQIVHRNDDEVPAPMMVAALQNSGYVRLYNTRTGEMSLNNRSWLKNQLKKVWPGTKDAVWSPRKPEGITPTRGALKCPLHPEHADNPSFVGMGLPECKKANLINEYEVQRHVRFKHPSAFAAIERKREQADRDESRDLMKAQTAAMQALAAANTPAKKASAA